MSGWAHGQCQECSDFGPVKSVASGWKCGRCIASKSVDNPLDMIRCPECQGWMTVDDSNMRQFRCLHIAQCQDCGLTITVDGNGRTVDLTIKVEPPPILCSSCGEVLQREADSFRCQCGRVVTA